MHFNPRSPHGERHLALIHSDREKLISIHAPRTGSDSSWGSICAATGHFNPRSPHGERPTPKGGRQIFLAFQSTLPARGATVIATAFAFAPNISIHAPRTGSDMRRPAWRTCQSYFNPRSPHGERRETYTRRKSRLYFNPRSPHGERLAIPRVQAFQSDISIHAPRTGSDPASRFQSYRSAYFNPRSPHGERRQSHGFRHFRAIFQSTLPARGATSMIIMDGCCTCISIHAPRTGSDPTLSFRPRHGGYFNPRSPHGERQGFKFRGIDDVIFQSTLPARGATLSAAQNHLSAA